MADSDDKKAKITVTLNQDVIDKLPELQKKLEAAWEHHRKMDDEVLKNGQEQMGMRLVYASPKPNFNRSSTVQTSLIFLMQAHGIEI